MMRLLALLIMVATLAVVLALLFVLLVLPMWLLVHCAISKTESNKAKAIWIVLMILTWPLAGYVYGLCRSRTPVLQWSSAFSVLVGLAVVGALITVPKWLLRDTSRRLQEVTIAQLPTTKMPGISDHERAQLIEDLQILHHDLQPERVSLRTLERRFVDMDLYELLQLFLADQQLTVSEYHEWTSRYALRGSINRGALDDYIRSLKRGR